MTILGLGNYSDVVGIHPRRDVDKKRMSSLGCDFIFFKIFFPLMFYSGQQVYAQFILLLFQSLCRVDRCPWEHPGSSQVAFVEIRLVRWAQMLGQWRS